MGVFLRKYGTGTGADVYVPLIKRGVVDFAVGADWSAASGDVKISIDGGAAASIGTLPTAVAMGNVAYWKFVFADAELQGKVIIVTVGDSATKAVEDQAFVIETYGHASAKFVADLSLANLPANVTQFGGSNGTFSSGRPEVNTSHIAGSAVSASSAQIGVNLVNIAGSAVSTSTAQLGVNVVNFGGSAGAFSSGRPEVNTTHAAGTAWGSGAITSGAFAAGAITASAIAADAIGASELATDAVTEIAAAVWNSAMASYQTAGTMGLAVNELDTIYQNAYDGITARLLANVTHANGTLYSTAITTPLGAVKTKTDQLTFTVANVVDSNTTQWKGSTAPAMTGDAYARLGAPVGASISADIAGVPAALLDLTDGIESGVTLRKAIRAIAAKSAGLVTGAGTGTEVVKGIGQSSGGTTRLTATVDSSGNISNWGLNL